MIELIFTYEIVTYNNCDTHHINIMDKHRLTSVKLILNIYLFVECTTIRVDLYLSSFH